MVYLLHLSSLVCQCHFCYLACLDYIQRSANAMADDCLRVWILTDSQSLIYLNACYPQPTTRKLATCSTAQTKAC
jgi:hypothetical protein